MYHAFYILLWIFLKFCFLAWNAYIAHENHVSFLIYLQEEIAGAAWCGNTRDGMFKIPIAIRLENQNIAPSPSLGEKGK